MKKRHVVIFIFLFSSLSSLAQVQWLNINLGGKIFINPSTQSLQAQGSPYVNQKFSYAKIENVIEKHFMRYNAYSDSFEFISFQNDTLEMDKSDTFRTITFTNPVKKYTYLDYLSKTKGREKGYLVELYAKADFVLYKKESIVFYPGKKARTSLENDITATYLPATNTYFFKTKSGIINFPDNKKQLIRLFPDRKDAINDFIKENKIDFEIESDLYKIIDFLAQ